MKAKIGVMGVSLIVGATVAHIPAIVLSLFAGLLESRPSTIVDILFVIVLVGVSLTFGIVAFRWTYRYLLPFVASNEFASTTKTGVCQTGQRS